MARTRQRTLFFCTTAHIKVKPKLKENLYKTINAKCSVVFQPLGLSCKSTGQRDKGVFCSDAKKERHCIIACHSPPHLSGVSLNFVVPLCGLWAFLLVPNTVAKLLACLHMPKDELLQRHKATSGRHITPRQRPLLRARHPTGRRLARITHSEGQTSTMDCLCYGLTSLATHAQTLLAMYVHAILWTNTHTLTGVSTNAI